VLSDKGNSLALAPGDATLVAMPTSAEPQPQRRLDDESREWISALRDQGKRREDAAARLHEILLRASRFEVQRRKAAMPHLRGNDFDDVAHQAAGDAMMAILGKLDDFRGESRFTTWAYKFALLEAAVKLRRRSWQGRELPVDSEQWSQMADRASSPVAGAEQRALLGQIQEAIETELSPHQREVLMSIAVNGVPIDVMAERLNTTRGALYKTVHDARKKLRAGLETAGYELQDRHEVGNE
jgi:RNA polymerase sigma-70 factor, ECF subfamily